MDDGSSDSSKLHRGSLLHREDLSEVVPDNSGRLSSVDGMPEAEFLIILDDGAGLLVEGGEALTEGVHVII